MPHPIMTLVASITGRECSMVPTQMQVTASITTSSTRSCVALNIEVVSGRRNSGPGNQLGYEKNSVSKAISWNETAKRSYTMSLTNYLLGTTLVILSFTHTDFPGTSLFGPKQEVLMEDSTVVKIKLVPIDLATPPKGTPYRVENNMRVKILVTNNSSTLIKALVVDIYYQNRPQLFKDGQLVAYREEIAKLVRAKDADPEFVRVGTVVSLAPTTTTELEELNLADWYEPLKPGLYTLINRHRFEVDGPWSSDSGKLLFEVVLQQ
jgi:hypothetical protein